MELKQLIYGVGSILRENVSDWATSDTGTPHVYPDHPPGDLSAGSYPRATVDVIGNSQMSQDIEQDAEIDEPLLDVTVYATNSSDVTGILGKCHQAILDYHDKDDSNGDPYLDTWAFSTTGTISPLIDEDVEAGFTRYNRTMEFEFTGVTQTTV